jgi:hypothetical protein
MKRFLTLILVIVILMITDLGCATTKGNIYRSGDFTTEFKYYDSSKGEKCNCPPPKTGDKYICECIDTKDNR